MVSNVSGFSIAIDPALFGRIALGGFRYTLEAPAGAARESLREEWLAAVAALKSLSEAGRDPLAAPLKEMRALRPAFDPRRPIYPYSERLLHDALAGRAEPPALAVDCLCEIIALASFCPAFALDETQARPPLTLRPPSPDENLRVNGSPQSLDDFALMAGGAGPLATPTLRGDAGRADAATRRLLLVIFAPQAGERLRRALALAADLGARHLEARPMESFQAGI
jgi:hypothetical protein